MTHQTTRRSFLRTTAFGVTAAIAAPDFAADKNLREPNMVVISLDSFGFADFSPFGNTAYPASNISKLATEGCRFTNFHLAPTIGSVAQSALLTGYDPEGSKLIEATGPSESGMDTQYSTIAQALKPQGYTSAIFGKGHTKHAVDFIKDYRKRPFFLYVTHSMPHVPLFVSREFENKSGEGLYADVMMELDWSTGQITGALQESGVVDNTLVIFTADNGPWTDYGNHASKTPYRESEGASFDDNTRCTCIMKMPGRIAAGTTSEQVLCSIELMPIFAAIAGAKTV